MARPSRTDLWLENLRDERDGAALYTGLAALETDPDRARRFRDLAEAEGRHAAIWSRKLEKSGVALPPDRLSLRVRALLWLCRVVGPKAVLPFVVRAETGDARKYERQGAVALAAEEEQHREVLVELSAPTTASARIGRRERWHNPGASNWLRAAVFGVNDGIISNLSLVLGVAGAGADQSTLVLTGIAGMLAGACSMAAGEYTSVASQRDVLRRQVELERREIEDAPEEEAGELAAILEQKGLTPEHARRASDDVMKDPKQALDTLVRFELGLDPDDLGSPFAAAASSLTTFAVGAFVPILPFLLLEGNAALAVSVVAAGGALGSVGAGLGLLSGASPWRSGGRMLGIAAVAAALTYGLGRLFGATLG